MIVPAAVGRGVPQRWQFFSPGGLATPQAGLVHRLGGPSGSAAAPSGWSKKPQSMQAMAPGKSTAWQAGHSCAGPAPAGAAPGAGMVNGISSEPLPARGGTFGGAAGATAATAGWRAAAGTWKAFLHDGQRTTLPAA